MRKFDRRQTELPVTVSAPGGGKAQGGIKLDAADVSEGGAFLRSDLLFEIGETLSLEIPLPSGQVIKAQGRVVRVARRDGGQAGMGIEFLDLSLQDRRAISASLARLAGAAVSRAARPTP